MTTTWERFAGSEERFAVRLAFRPDPDPGSVDPDERLSWGGLQIWVKGKNLCAHVDQGETLESIHWYLLGLLEWLAASWDPLLHEERLPIRVGGVSAIESLRETALLPEHLGPAEQTRQRENEWFGWWERHGTRVARNGGPFPDLVIRRSRDRIELSWGDAPLAGGEGLEFLASSGSARIDPSFVASPLLEVLRAAAAELAARSASGRFAALVDQVAELDAPARKSERLAWMAGLRTHGHSVRESWQRVEEAFSGVAADAREAALRAVDGTSVVHGSCQAALLFGAVAPDVSEEDVRRLAALLVEQYSPGSEAKELVELSQSRALSPAVPPWQDGYELAGEIREALGLPAGEPPDIDALLSRLGIEMRHLSLDDSSIRGVTVAGPDHKPTIAINDASVYGQSDQAERFTLAHELCHLLFDRGLGSKLAVASGPWAPREIEQRANAFAALLLMPAEGLWREFVKLDASIKSLEGIDELAKRFHVSSIALIEHLPNVGLISHTDRERLRREVRS